MSNKEAVKRLVALLKSYKRVIACIVGCLLISTAMNLCVPLLSKRIMDEGFIGGDKKLLIQLVMCSLAIYFISSLLDMMKEKKRINISAKLQYTLTEEAFSHLMKMKLDYFNDKNYAEIINNINVDINHMTSIADEGVFFVVTQAFSMTGGVSGLFILDYRLTILVLLFIPIKYIVAKYFARQQGKVMDEFIKDSQKYANWFGDTIGGIREIKLFGLFDRKHNEFEKEYRKVIQKQKKMNWIGQWNSISDTILVHILSTMIYIIGANLVFNLQLSVGSVFAFVTYSTYVTGPISSILNIGYLLAGIIPSTRRYYEFMDLKEEAEDRDCFIEASFGDIEFCEVSFAYEKEKPVFKNLNLKIVKGSKVAIIGKNGSGKSTIINLLLRMYKPYSGLILLNGNNIYDIPLSKYRSMVSVVSQELYLFNDTIRNNICLYDRMEDNKILDVCKDCGLFDFIHKVSLNYVVGQNGAMLSGGQKQKIALARALIQDRPIVIFDEATSGADAYSEQQINGLIQTKLKNKTVIIITHKKDILSKVDQIILLKEGGKKILPKRGNI